MILAHIVMLSHVPLQEGLYLLPFTALVQSCSHMWRAIVTATFSCSHSDITGDGGTSDGGDGDGGGTHTCTRQWLLLQMDM